MKLTLRNAPEDALTRLFEVRPDGRLMMGSTNSRIPVPDLATLQDWTPFLDYVMEGFVTFDLRVERTGNDLLLELRFAGTSRDRYVARSLQDAAKSVKLSLEVTETEHS